MTEFGLTTKRYLTDLVLQKLDDKVEFFQDSKLEPMTLWDKSLILTMNSASSEHRQV